MVMGANVGTSITSTLVSLTQITHRDRFEKAFTCAVLLDIFNVGNTIIFFLMELSTGFLNVSRLYLAQQKC